MEHVLEILKYILPSVVTFFAAYYVLKAFLQNEQKKKLLEIKMKGGEAALPLRLQAYERIMLLIERISIQNLLVRATLPGKTAKELHAYLIGTVRQEFDHNLSQQLYVSTDTWEIVRSAKEEVLKVINTTYSKMPEDASGRDLVEAIMETHVKMKNPLTTKASVVLKKEVTRLF